MKTLSPKNIRKQRTIRFSDNEWAKISAGAVSVNLPPATFIRTIALATNSKDLEKIYTTTESRKKEVAHVLSRLAATNIPLYLTQILEHMRLGCFTFSNETEQNLNETCEEIKAFTEDLIYLLGLRK